MFRVGFVYNKKMNDSKAHFAELLGCKDDRDKDINFSTTGMVMGFNLNNSILSDKKLHDDYFRCVLNIAISLQKANSHYRKYVENEEAFIKEYEKKHVGKGNNSNSSTAALELVTEIDGVLSNYKSSLDSLAKTFSSMYGISIRGWHKAKDSDGVEKSGLRVLNTLGNLPKETLVKTEPLRDYIMKNVNWATFLVSMRDDVHHSGGIKGVTNIVYDFEDDKVYPQFVVYEGGQKELVSEFLNRVIDQTIDFVRNVLLLTIQSKLHEDMFIVKNTKAEFPPYIFAVNFKKD